MIDLSELAWADMEYLSEVDGDGGMIASVRQFAKLEMQNANTSIDGWFQTLLACDAHKF